MLEYQAFKQQATPRNRWERGASKLFFQIPLTGESFVGGQSHTTPIRKKGF